MLIRLVSLSWVVVIVVVFVILTTWLFVSGLGGSGFVV